MYFVEKTKGTNYVKQFDYILFISVFVLSVIGILVLMSAINSQADWKSDWYKQLICLILGIILALVTCRIDYKDFKTLGIILYLLSIFLLVYVLIFGNKINGARSWINVPLIGTLQPSELAKLSFVIIIPVYLERIKENMDVRKNTIKMIIYTLLPIALVLRQPDVGTALVFIFTFFVFLFAYGVPYKYFLYTIGAFAASTPVLWFFMLPTHIKERINAYLSPEYDLSGRGLQVFRSKMTVGSGQFWGKGIFKGLQTQNSSSLIKSSSSIVPEKQNDFIFSVIGEELGFIGSIIVIGLICLILFRCLYIAQNSRDDYGAFVVVGITAILAFHFIENIGMCIGVLPVTGIPLPFMSQGGSSLVTNYIAVGVLLSVSMRRKRAIFNST